MQSEGAAKPISTLQAALRVLLLAAALAPGAALAQFSHVPLPAVAGEPLASDAADDRAYRRDAARHVYGSYPMRIHHGKLPSMMYAVMITDTEIDPQGQVLGVTVVRPPAAAAEVTPWVQNLIRRASPFPAPRGVVGNVVYREIWLVDKSGKFQVDTLTEGQL